MKRVFLSIICTFASLALTAPSLGHSGGTDANGCHAGSKPYHCHGGKGGAGSANRSSGDRDCSDFASWEDAQDFFESSGYGDPHRLDGDDDGIACEALR